MQDHGKNKNSTTMIRPLIMIKNRIQSSNKNQIKYSQTLCMVFSPILLRKSNGLLMVKKCLKFHQVIFFGLFCRTNT